MNDAATTDLVDDYKRRAAYYERVYFKPERQADLRAMEAWVADAFAGRRVLELACGTGWWTPHGASRARQWLDNRFVQTSNLPITRRDAEGNTYQNRSVDDGSVHEVLKNFPTADELRTLLAARATGFQWTAWTHDWAASWTVAA